MSQRKRNKVKVEETGGRFVEDVERVESTGITASSSLARAVAHHLDGRLREALAELNRAIDAGVANAEIYSAQGHLQFELERYDAAAASYEEVLKLLPDHPSAAFNLAVCLERMERWSAAAEKFAQAAAQDPNRVEALAGLGIARLRMENPEEALPAFEKCLELDPSHHHALFGKGVALQLLKQSGEAVEVYKRIIEKNPDSEEALVNLIGVGIASKNEKMTQEYSERLLTIRAHSQAAIEGLALCAFWRGDYEAATQLCTKLVEFTPDSFERRFNLGVAYQRTGHLEQAAAAYQEAARIKPDAAQALVNLGVVLHEMGNQKGASQAYERP